VVSFTPRPLYPWKIAPGTHWKVGWVGPRTSLDNVEKRKFLALQGLELRPLCRPARIASRYTDCFQKKYSIDRKTTDRQKFDADTGIINGLFP
jgi:hypothetical protein